MLDPTRFSLDAATVGFRKRTHQSVDWTSFDNALQNQTDSIKVRRELEETPMSEIHVMGGGLFGIGTNEKTKTAERQRRQINGYPLRSFLANGGPIVLPPKHGEGLMATPMNVGIRQYTQYNAVVGNYVSSFTEPLQAPLDNNTIMLARSGVQALSNSATNPYAALQFMLNLNSTQAMINNNQQEFLNRRSYNQQGSIRDAVNKDTLRREIRSRAGRTGQEENNGQGEPMPRGEEEVIPERGNVNPDQETLTMDKVRVLRKRLIEEFERVREGGAPGPAPGDGSRRGGQKGVLEGVGGIGNSGSFSTPFSGAVLRQADGNREVLPAVNSADFFADPTTMGYVGNYDLGNVAYTDLAALNEAIRRRKEESARGLQISSPDPDIEIINRRRMSPSGQPKYRGDGATFQTPKAVKSVRTPPSSAILPTQLKFNS